MPQVNDDRMRVGDRIGVGDIRDSRAVAIGRGAVAIEARGNVTLYQGPTYSRLDYRAEVAPLLEFYCRSFVGREQELRALYEFARQESSGYLLVEAGSGYGKSALMAQPVLGGDLDCLRFGKIGAGESSKQVGGGCR